VLLLLIQISNSCRRCIPGALERNRPGHKVRPDDPTQEACEGPHCRRCEFKKRSCIDSDWFFLDCAARPCPLSVEAAIPFMEMVRDSSAEILREMKALADNMSEDSDDEDMPWGNDDASMASSPGGNNDVSMASYPGSDSDASMASSHGSYSDRTGDFDILMPDASHEESNDGWVKVKGKKKRKLTPAGAKAISLTL
jgi:hypothetical protein